MTLTIKYKIRDRVLLLPDDHNLPVYQKTAPTYDMAFDSFYRAIGSHAPDRYFIDIGANVGDTAVVMRYNATNPILCVEGHPPFLTYLRQNTQGLADTKIASTFIGAEELAGASLQFGSRHGTGAFALTSDKDAAPPAAAAPLQQVLGDALRRGIALFKTDTDGMDAFILEEFLKLDAGKPALFFECDLVQTLLGERGEEVWRANFDILKGRGYSLIIFDNFGYQMASCSPSSYELVWELNRYIKAQYVNEFIHTYYLDVWAFPPEMATIFEASRACRLPGEPPPRNVLVADDTPDADEPRTATTGSSTMSEPLKKQEWLGQATSAEVRGRCPDVRDELFWELYDKWRGETLIPPERLYPAYMALRTALMNNVDGAIAECGVFRGGSFCFFMEVVAALAGPTRDFWAFDTFDGFPPDVDEKLIDGSRFTRESWHTESFEHVFDSNVARSAYPKSRITTVKGSVLDTIPARAPSTLAFLHLDTDYYEATLHELTHLYDRVPRGGAIMIDDYGHFEGCRKAVDEFLLARTPQPIMLRADYTGRLLIKV